MGALVSTIQLTSYYLLPNAPLVMTCLSLLMTIPIIMFILEINRRKKLIRLYADYKIPHVDDTNLFSGNLFELIVPGYNTRILQFKHQELGETFGMFYGPEPWIFTTDVEIIYKLFVAEGHKYTDATLYSVPFPLFHESLVQVQGDRWKGLRKAVAPAFSLAKMKTDNVLEDISTATEYVIDSIELAETNKDLNGKNYRIINILDKTKRFSAEVIMRIGFGQSDEISFSAEKDPLLSIIEDASRRIKHPITWMTIMFPTWRPFFSSLVELAPIGRQVKTIIGRLSKTINEKKNKINSNLRKMKDDDNSGKSNVERDRKMIDSLIENHNENLLSERELLASAFLFFLAGFETTANTLAITIWHLAKNQDIQDRLRTEIIQEGDRSKLLEWVILETLRLFPAVPTAVGRRLHKDTEINGQVYPKGATINANIYALHHEKKYWGDDVEEFKPDRFSDEKKRHPSQFFAFAQGPRNCLGGKLAMIEMKTLICRVILKYKVEICPTTSEAIHFISPNLIHMIIKHPLYVKLVNLQ